MNTTSYTSNILNSTVPTFRITWIHDIMLKKKCSIFIYKVSNNFRLTLRVLFDTIVSGKTHVASYKMYIHLGVPKFPLLRLGSLGGLQ